MSYLLTEGVGTGMSYPTANLVLLRIKGFRIWYYIESAKTQKDSKKTKILLMGSANW